MPWWHVGPCGFAKTKRVSLSQSAETEITSSVLPEIAPFSHSRFFVLLQNVTFLLLMVLLNAHLFINPNISTAFVSTSWITAGIMPPNLAKFNCLTLNFFICVLVDYCWIKIF